MNLFNKPVPLMVNKKFTYLLFDPAIAYLHRVAVKRKAPAKIPIILAGTEILLRGTFYLFEILILFKVLIFLIFYLGLIFPNSVGQFICNLVKKNASLSIQKTYWKDLVFTYTELESTKHFTHKSKQNFTSKRYVWTTTLVAKAAKIAAAKAKTLASVGTTEIGLTVVGLGFFVTGVQMIGLDQVGRHEISYRYNQYLDPDFKIPPFVIKDPEYIFRPPFTGDKKN